MPAGERVELLARAARGGSRRGVRRGHRRPARVAGAPRRSRQGHRLHRDVRPRGGQRARGRRTRWPSSAIPRTMPRATSSPASASGSVALAEAPRIALVKLSSLGDVVHALPLAATLRAARPGGASHLGRRAARGRDPARASRARRGRRRRHAGVAAGPERRRARRHGARDAPIATTAGRRALRRRHRRAGADQERRAGGCHPRARADRLRAGASSASRSTRCSPPSGSRRRGRRRTWWISAWPCWTRSA